MVKVLGSILLDGLEALGHHVFYKWANPGLLLFIHGLFNLIKQFVQEINVKKVHLVFGARFRTHS